MTHATAAHTPALTGEQVAVSSIVGETRYLDQGMDERGREARAEQIRRREGETA